MAGPADATPVFEAQKRATPEIKAVADFLRGKNGPKVRRGILNGKRVDYFKGKTAIRTLLGPAYAKVKKAPKVTTEDEAKALLNKVLPHAFFLRVDRPEMDPPPAPGTPKTVQLAPQQSIDEIAYYAWFYDGSPLYTILGGIAMVAIMLAGVMFPLWPVKLRVGVWYLSILVLIFIGAMIVLAIVRLIFWCITVLCAKRAIWIFPNLFEDVGFFDSFVPVWAYDEPKKKRRVKKDGSSKSSRSKSARSKVGGTSTPAEGTTEGEAEAESVEAKSSAVEVNGGVSGSVERRSATVEEIDDDES
ncbi:translocation protein Sec62-domain-containing protein [Papiliotrema laurentii]|uniref:Translocation protein SEC62 n=1 Tax=Papiliotrema laurentii TaxID=5418 RepID=A0AAD9FQZ4_PAPLA|nr:translocation protein Sec62-domain-containing protein [Papiliotrema laurentii]